MRFWILASLAAAIASPASAITVQEFITRGESLESLGPLALLSPEYKALHGEFHPALMAWRAQVKKAQPPVCAPPKIRLMDDDIMVLVREVPPAERTKIEVLPAVIRQLNLRYRCK